AEAAGDPIWFVSTAPAGYPQRAWRRWETCTAYPFVGVVIVELRPSAAPPTPARFWHSGRCTGRPAVAPPSGVFPLASSASGPDRVSMKHAAGAGEVMRTKTSAARGSGGAPPGRSTAFTLSVSPATTSALFDLPNLPFAFTPVSVGPTGRLAGAGI